MGLTVSNFYGGPRDEYLDVCPQQREFDRHQGTRRHPDSQLQGVGDLDRARQFLDSLLQRESEFDRGQDARRRERMRRTEASDGLPDPRSSTSNRPPIVQLDAGCVGHVTPSATNSARPGCSESETKLWPGGTMARIANSTSTEDWLDRMNSLNYILNAEEGDDYTRVKIAVLDTGVDPSNAAARYIKGYKDYVSRNDSIMCDNTGHGTTSVNLAFSICESADIYAVRIFENDKANENTRELAAEAIDWCMTEEMDIICMACGFFSNYDTLHEKVRRASEKMLIIAAPTNDGNASEIAYPAAYGEVLSMFSTNGAVKKSRFNPSNPPEKYNFAILGEDIKTPRGELDCGTSFSTAIAAGFTGRLMDFSRHGDTKCHIQNAEKMKNKTSMIQVLLHIIEWDDPYYCIKPWKLLPEELRNRIPFTMSDLPTEEEKRGARKRIWQMISLGCWN